ncbi:MAG: hypothetical protein ACNS62_01910 [Candidatus Cyclobacteriaceae bacterium M3_2C_046]
MKKIMFPILFRFFLITQILLMTHQLLGQDQPIAFRKLNFAPVNEAKMRKSQYALANCGLSYRYDSTSQQLHIRFQDPRYLAKIFNHKKDQLELNIGQQVYILNGDEIRDQLMTNYYDRYLPRQLNVYQQILTSLPVHVDESITSYKSLYKTIKALPDLNIDTRNSQKLARQYKEFRADHKELVRFLKNRKYNSRIIKADDGPWNITFQAVPSGDFSLDFFQKNAWMATLQFDTLYGQPARFLNQYEMANCKPFNRFTYFKKINGLNLKRYQFQPYRPLEQLRGYKTFTIYFEQSKSEVTSNDVKDIVKMMNDSSYTIRKAKVFAYASVEGADSINHRLQQERSRVILSLLQDYNQDSIELVELKTDENWERFNQQIKNTSWQYLADSSRSYVKSLLADPETYIQWQDSLAVQRKAILKLQFYHQADTIDQTRYAIKQYYKLLKILATYSLENQEASFRVQLKILSVDDFLKRMVRAGKLSRSVYQELLSFSPPLMDKVRFYSMLLDDMKNLPNVYDDREDVIARAYDAVLYELYQVDYNKHRQRYLQSQAIDIQLYSFEKLEAGEISPEVICKFKWPEKPVFYPLILNEMDYVNKQSRDFVGQLSCYRLDSTEQDQQNKNNKNPHEVSFDAPLNYQLPHSGYYFFLKKRIMEDDQDIKKLAVRSDDYMEFDLYEFLSYNIFNWDVWNNRYYDEAVDFHKMNRLMNHLISINDILCPMQMYQLYLNLHLKISYSIRHDQSYRHTKEVYSSLRKLQQYFLKHMSAASEQDVLALADHLIWMGKYFQAQQTIEMAQQLLKKLNQQGLITEHDMAEMDRLTGIK